MRYKIPAGYLPVVALIAVQTLGALTAGYAWFVAAIAVETLAALMPPRRPALASGRLPGWRAGPDRIRAAAAMAPARAADREHPLWPRRAA
jgi:hypothetical protein